MTDPELCAFSVLLCFSVTLANLAILAVVFKMYSEVLKVMALTKSQR